MFVTVSLEGIFNKVFIALCIICVHVKFGMDTNGALVTSVKQKDGHRFQAAACCCLIFIERKKKHPNKPAYFPKTSFTT
jgi:hypothetical protein